MEQIRRVFRRHKDWSFNSLELNLQVIVSILHGCWKLSSGVLKDAEPSLWMSDSQTGGEMILSQGSPNIIRKH